MKRIYTLIATVVALTVSSCATKSDINDLQSQINDLKNGRIATIEQQITNIQASITSLQATDTQLSTFVSTLQLETFNIKADFTAKEKALSDRIDNLKQYVDDELGKSKDWVSATFATLDQYQAVLDDLAEVKESITNLDIDLRKEIEDSIKDSEDSMKGWVNEQLAGYYTIAQMDAKLKALADADAANEQALEKVAANLETAKTELTEAYTKAITDAITNYNGTITTKIAADIKTATDALRQQIDALDERVSALEGRIQSVVIIPDYSDGSVMASIDGILTLNCIISPASSVKGLTKDNINAYVADGPCSLSKISVDSFFNDKNLGITSISINISSFLMQDTTELSAAISIKRGNSEITSAFIPIMAYEDCTTIIAGHNAIDLGTDILWSDVNIGAETPSDFGLFFSWGEIEPKSNYTWRNYKWSNGLVEPGSSSDYDDLKMTKYCLYRVYGVKDDKSVLEPDDDAATQIWKNGWRMPTKKEVDALKADCTWEWTCVEGVNGYKVTSPTTRKSIFLPANGAKTIVGWHNKGMGCNYWTSSLNQESEQYYAYSFMYTDDGLIGTERTMAVFRYLGLGIRPVHEK